MRVQSTRAMHNGGWWHGQDVVKVFIPVKEDKRPTINATAMFRDWLSKTDVEWIKRLSQNLCVAFEALNQIGCAWAAQHRAWAFPMKDGYGNIIGIRLRDESGRKWAVTGSRAGIFFGGPMKGMACVCEGPTDTAAAITIGFNAVGRPSCSGSEDVVMTALSKATRVLIISDNDGPGWQGALRLQEKLKQSSLVWCPPAKDFRDFVKAGATKAMIELLTGSAVWSTARSVGDYIAALREAAQ